VLVLVGLYVRLRIAETPAFRAAMAARRRVAVPIVEVVRRHGGTLLLGTLMGTVTFALFYLMTVFAQGWAISQFKVPRSTYLQVQMFAVLFFALFIPLSGRLADAFGGRRTMIVVTVGIVVYGLFFGTLMGGGSPLELAVFLSIGMALMGSTYGPVGSVLAHLYPTPVRYTGLSLSFNLAGILGGSLSPYLATWLAKSWSVHYVGFYLALVATVTLAALLAASRLERLHHGDAVRSADQSVAPSST
jgi:MFS family permease